MVIDKRFFLNHQKDLLWIANSKIGSRLLGIDFNKTKGKRIDHITPNSIRVLERVFYNRGQLQAEYTQHFCVGNIYAVKLSKILFWLPVVSQQDNQEKFILRPAYQLALIALTTFLTKGMFFALTTTNFAPGSITSTNPTNGDCHNFDTNYTTSHDASACPVNQNRFDDGSGGGAHYAGQFLTGGNYHVYRSFDCWDTSSLTSGATISAGVVTWKISDVGTANSFNLNVYAGTPAVTTTLATTDYATSHFGSTSFGSIASSSLGSIGTTFDITLNSSGLAGISKTSITTFGYRSDNDVSSSAPSGSQYVACYIHSSASSGGNPNLAVTFTLPAGPANLKTFNGLAKASIKTVDGLAVASVKTINGLA